MVSKRLTVRRTNQLHTAFSNQTRRESFKLASDLINDDDFGIVILNGFDHPFMLQHRLADLHATRFANSRMRHITITADLIRCIYDDHAFVLRQNARGLTQESRLANAWSPKNQRRFTRLDDVLNNIHGAIDGTTNAQS